MDRTEVRVLLIEDDEDDYLITRELLAESGLPDFDLEWVCSYIDGLAVLLDQKHDICLLDYRLGAQTGVELLREARGRGCRTPVIMLTGQGDQAVDMEAMRAGASDYLVKARLDPVILERTIRYTIERNRSEEVLRQSEARLAAAQRLAHVGSWDLSYETHEVRGSDELYRILGFAPGQHVLTFDLLRDGIHPADRAYVQATTAEALAHRIPLRTEHRIIRPDGEIRFVEAQAEIVRDPHGAPTSMVGTLLDITERKTLELQLTHQAFHDPLTNLPNRALFMNRVEHILAGCARHSQLVALLFMDLDNFKVINDSLGHQAGDQLLVAVAERILTWMRAQDTIARIGGDEFAILLQDIGELTAVVGVAERIIAELRLPFHISGYQVVITPSIGIVVSTGGDDQPSDLFRKADLAMYRAKAQGKAGYALFDASMNAAALERLELEADLRQALATNEFEVHYQPIICLETGSAAGMEALVRWRHPKHGLVPPSKFIPLAEETGLIVPLGRLVLREACRQARLWQDAYVTTQPVIMSVNLSARQFQYPRLVEDVAQILSETGLRPECLKLEITESIMMHDPDWTVSVLHRLKAFGINLALDDFGTGYSSLTYLKRLPVDTIKIDRSFINRLGLDVEDTAIVGAIMALAKTLNLTVTGEGIETEEQLRHLQTLGCDQAQGYYFARPLPGIAASAIFEDAKSTGPIRKVFAHRM